MPMEIKTSTRAQAEWIAENAQQLLVATGDCEVIVTCEVPGEEFSERFERLERDWFAKVD